MRCVVVAAVALATSVSLGAFTVDPADGRFAILRNGETFISSVSVDRGEGIGEDDVRQSSVTLADGTRVWNRWSETWDRQFRLEVAEHPTGEIEITMAGEVPCGSKEIRRFLSMDVPSARLDGKAWRSIRGVGTRYNEQQGTFGTETDGFSSRWLAVDGMTFDFNPFGAGDNYGGAGGSGGDGWRHMDAMYGNWSVSRADGSYRLRSGSDVRTSWGGYAGTKVVIREGAFADYGSRHALASFRYNIDFPAVRQVAFGSPVRGRQYAEGDVVFTSVRGCGWTEDHPWERNPVVGFREGAFYSALAGDKRETYRFAGLPAGFYLFSFAAGNYACVSNRFTVTANGETVIADGNVPDRTVRRVMKVLPVRNGTVDVAFTGNWLVSTMALQPLVFDAEDFSFNRGPWVTDGFEPGKVYGNSYLPGPPAFATIDRTEDLPEPGTEFAGAPREPVWETEQPDPSAPELGWTRNPKIFRVFNNSSSFAEFERPGAIADYFDREVSGKGINAIMLSGMLSRHTYIGREGHSLDAVRRIAAEAHRRGIRVIDHIDVTLLWNCDNGFRVLAERLGELIVSKDTQLPSYQFCTLNPDLVRKFIAYARKDVEAGVDGFQLDEVATWPHGCTCPHCRAAFERDVGWKMPMNEVDPAWLDRDSPFFRRWIDWRSRKTTDFLIAVRRALKDIAPNLVLSTYSTGECLTARRMELERYGMDYCDRARAVNLFGIEQMCRSMLKGFRPCLPLLRHENIVTDEHGFLGWDWYYNADWQNDYAAWAMSAMTGRIPLLSDVDRGPEVPDYPAFSTTPGAMRRDGARTIARVALLMSYASRDWNDAKVDAMRDVLGTAQALEAMHIPYEFVSDRMLESRERLSKYRTLCLLSSQCVSDAGVEAVRDFAAKGGTVVLSEIAGTLDLHGDPRKTPPFDGLSGRVFRSAVSRGEPFHLKHATVGYNLGYPGRFAPDPDAEAAFRREVAGWVSGAEFWRTDAPEQVLTSLWREDDGNLAIHFLNATGVHNDPDEKITGTAPDPAFPPLGKDIVFTVPEGHEAVATSPDFPGERRLASVRGADGSLTVTLPKRLLKVYALVRVR